MRRRRYGHHRRFRPEEPHRAVRVDAHVVAALGVPAKHRMLPRGGILYFYPERDGEGLAERRHRRAGDHGFLAVKRHAAAVLPGGEHGSVLQRAVIRADGILRDVRCFVRFSVIEGPPGHEACVRSLCGPHPRQREQYPRYVFHVRPSLRLFSRQKPRPTR